MNLNEFNEIKRKIEDAKNQKVVAEAKIKDIEKELKEEFDIDNIEDAEKLQNELSSMMANLTEKEQDLIQQLDTLLEGQI
jgi:hypothetical protein